MAEVPLPKLLGLQAADLGGDGAGERALFATEQLGLQELLGQGRAVDRDQRLAAWEEP